MLGWYEGSESVYIAMEYLELGDLHQRIQQTRVSEMEVKVIMRQLFGAVLWLHDRDIAHCDWKPKVCYIARV